MPVTCRWWRATGVLLRSLCRARAGFWSIAVVATSNTSCGHPGRPPVVAEPVGVVGTVELRSCPPPPGLEEGHFLMSGVRVPGLTGLGPWETARLVPALWGVGPCVGGTMPYKMSELPPVGFTGEFECVGEDGMALVSFRIEIVDGPCPHGDAPL